MAYGINRKNDCDCESDFWGENVQTLIAWIVIILMVVLLLF